MRKIKIADQDPINFICENQAGLFITRMFISHDIFEKIWDEALAKNGQIEVKQPNTAISKENPYGYYRFAFKKANRNGELQPVEVVIKNYGLLVSDHKQLKICKLAFGGFLYQENNQILAPRIYIGTGREKEKLFEKEI